MSTVPQVTETTVTQTAEGTLVPAKKPRKQRSDKGRVRGPRKPKAVTTEG